MTSTKRNQKISLETLETTLEKLDNLSEKKQKEITLRQSVHFLRDKLQKNSEKRIYLSRLIRNFLATRNFGICGKVKAIFNLGR